MRQWKVKNKTKKPKTTDEFGNVFEGRWDLTLEEQPWKVRVHYLGRACGQKVSGGSRVE